MSTATLRDLARALPPARDIRAAAQFRLMRGATVPDVIDELVEVLDRIVDWRDVIPGPAGEAAEASDGALLRLFVRLVVGAVGRKRNRATGAFPNGDGGERA